MSIAQSQIESVNANYVEELNGVLRSSQNEEATYEQQTILHTYAQQALPVNQQEMPFVKQNMSTNGGAFVFFLLIAVLWSWFVQTNFKSVAELVKAEFNYKAFVNQLGDNSGANIAVVIGLLVSGLALLAYAFTESAVQFEIPQLKSLASGSLSGVVAFVLLMGYLFAKVLVLFLSGFVTGQGHVFNQYFTLNVISYQFIGLVLFPLLIIYRFAPLFNPVVLLYLALGVVAILFVYRILRMFVISVNQRSANFFHIILYICALEILPILLLMKWQLGQ